jgi:serine/threonine protein kinase
MTTTAVAVGPPAYMSPEQILTNPLDGCSDQFSLAIADDPPHAATINASIPEPATTVLNRSLSRDATVRYGTCLEFPATLEAAPHHPNLQPRHSRVYLRKLLTKMNIKNHIRMV